MKLTKVKSIKKPKKARKKKPAKGIQQRKVEFQTQRAVSSVLKGSMLVIDPSSGSSSSMPGYAIFASGELLDSGILTVNANKELPRRLVDIAKCLREQFSPVNVLVIEDIPVRAHGRNATGHASLLKSVGAILSAAQYDQFIEVSPSVWKAYIEKTIAIKEKYVKGDEWDAKVIGYCVIDLAKELQAINKNKET